MEFDFLKYILILHNLCLKKNQLLWVEASQVAEKVSWLESFGMESHGY